MSKFGERLRQERERKSLFLRQVAAKAEIDTAMLSKIERGERPAKKEHLKAFARTLDIDYKELHTLWLASKVYDVLKDEENALDGLKVAEEEIIYNKRKESNSRD